jgi:hypothetical protein
VRRKKKRPFTFLQQTEMLAEPIFQFQEELSKPNNNGNNNNNNNSKHQTTRTDNEKIELKKISSGDGGVISNVDSIVGSSSSSGGAGNGCGGVGGGVTVARVSLKRPSKLELKVNLNEEQTALATPTSAAMSSNGNGNGNYHYQFNSNNNDDKPVGMSVNKVVTTVTTTTTTTVGAGGCVTQTTQQQQQQRSTTTTTTKKKKRRFAADMQSNRFSDVYSLTGEILGRGAYGQVFTCRNIYTGVEYAVKIIDKYTHPNRERVFKEIEIYLHCRDCTNILKIIEFFEDEEKF